MKRLRDALKAIGEWWERLLLDFLEWVNEMAGNRERCGVCGGIVDRRVAFWAGHLDAWVDPECIPAIVRTRGAYAITRWLRDGDLVGGR